MKKLLRSFLLRISGKDFSRHYNEISSLTSSEKLLAFQRTCLKDLVRHAYDNVPYYHETLERVGVVKSGLVDLSQFEKVPILTRATIRERHDELISRDYVKRKWYRNSTGGSTGEPIKFIQDGDYKRWRNATNKYFYKDMLGIDEGDAKEVVLWGSERDLFKGSVGLKAKLINWVKDTVFLNSFRMTEKDIDHYIKTINSCKPGVIRGYAGSLYQLCREINRKGAAVHSPGVVVAEAETLRNEMRQKIEGAFKVKLYNSYGSRECGVIAGECRHGSIHTFTFNNYVEILKDGHPAGEGEEGKVIITSLHNYSMPFLRYEIGDMAIPGPEKCKCGSPLPALEQITGRITDHFVKRDGTVVPAEFFIHLVGVVCKAQFIERFQVIQEDYEKIKIRVVLQEEADESAKKDVEDKIKTAMGGNCQVIWEFVEEIPKTKSGKYLYTKSLVWGKK